MGKERLRKTPKFIMQGLIILFLMVKFTNKKMMSATDIIKLIRILLEGLIINLEA